MFSKPAVLRLASVSIAILSVFLIPAVLAAQPFPDCDEALGTSGGAVSLADAVTATSDKKVDEWQNDIIKVSITRPGVLVISGEGAAAQGSLHSRGGSGSPFLADSAPVGTAHRPLTTVVRPGEHCVEVAPPAGATGDLRMRVTFFDVCRLGPQDDHGDSFLCATETALGESRTGDVSAADHDLFSFTLTAATEVTISVTGPSGLAAGLLGEDGVLLATDGRGSRTLGSGRYFVRLEAGGGPGGSYQMTIAAQP